MRFSAMAPSVYSSPSLRRNEAGRATRISGELPMAPYRDKRILNVEDHAPARFIRTRILERAGFGVDEVGTAAAALEGAANASLMLLDVRLPDGDGLTVCESVKQLHPSLPVIMVTSVYRTAQARRDAFSAGADAYLLEPVEPERLVETIARFVLRTSATASSNPIWVVTDAVGEIVELSADAASLLNLSPRGALRRNLTSFFVDDRPKLMGELLRAADGIIIERLATLHPRDRRRFRVRLDVSALPTATGERIRLRWLIDPRVNADAAAS